MFESGNSGIVVENAIMIVLEEDPVVRRVTEEGTLKVIVA